MAIIDETLKAVLASPRCNYLLAHETAKEILRRLSNDHRFPFQLESSDYCSEKLILWLNAAQLPVEPYSSDARTQVELFLSNRGQYYARLILAGQMHRMWCQVSEDDVPKSVQIIAAAIDESMTKLGYSFLHGKLLQEMADGHVTELDGKPATIFEALFSEID